MPPHRMRCSEVWGGIRSIDLDVCTRGLTASLYSRASESGKGGDIYYFSVCDSDLLTRIAIADVVGHGEAASLLGRWMYDALVERMNALDGNGILGDLNHRACERGFDALTTAAVIGVYRRDSNLYFSYAGHPPPLIRRRADKNWSPLTLGAPTGTANLPLGVTADTAYDQRHAPVVAGDRLVLYTDGLIEAPNPSGEPFGQDRLLTVLDRTGGEAPSEQRRAVLGAAQQHAGGSLAHDDVTLLVIEVQ